MNASQISFFSNDELIALGFASFGKNIRVSRKCSIYGADRMTLGDNVRIDDFCILSGELTIGSHIHIAAYCGLFGGSGIQMDDFSGLSSRVSIYSVSEDYSGGSLTNPTIPEEFRNLEAAHVVIGRHAIIGCGAVLMPGTNVAEGVAVGALSLARGKLEPWKVYSGIPARPIRERSRTLLDKERQFLARYDR